MLLVKNGLEEYISLFERNEILSIEKVTLKGRPVSLKRSFENIIQNGLTYGNKVYVNVQKGNKRAKKMIPREMFYFFH